MQHRKISSVSFIRSKQRLNGYQTVLIEQMCYTITPILHYLSRKVGFKSGQLK